MDPFPPRRTFKHHITGRTINRDLNIPGHMIPEYHLPYGPEDEAMLEAVVGYCIASWQVSAGSLNPPGGESEMDPANWDEAR